MVESMAEDALIDALDGRRALSGTFSASDLKEFEWRGWNPKGFAKRRNAHHTEIVFEIVSDDEWDNGMGIVVKSTRTSFGPFAKRTRQAAGEA